MFVRKIKFWLATGLMLALTPISVVAATQPAAKPAANGSTGQGLEISPPVMELAADPGQTVTATIRVRNVTQGELIAKGRADDFGAGDGENGQPKLLLNETGETRFSLKYWVTKVPDLDLAPGELKTSNIAITVPKNAEPGGHFGVIRFTAVPPNLEGTGVALSASIGTLVLLRVSGDVKNGLLAQEFSTGTRQKPPKGQAEGAIVKRSFFEYGPIAFVTRLKNAGSVHEKPKGSIVVSNTFGKSVGTLNLNEKGGNVLPDSIRRFEASLDKKQLFGRYTAKLSATYADGKKLSATTTFWVVPWKLIGLVIIGLIALFMVLRLTLRRYNEHIISQARRRR